MFLFFFYHILFLLASHLVKKLIDALRANGWPLLVSLRSLAVLAQVLLSKHQKDSKEETHQSGEAACLFIWKRLLETMIKYMEDPHIFGHKEKAKEAEDLNVELAFPFPLATTDAKESSIASLRPDVDSCRSSRVQHHSSRRHAADAPGSEDEGCCIRTRFYLLSNIDSYNQELSKLGQLNQMKMSTSITLFGNNIIFSGFRWPSLQFHADPFGLV
jgi:hypothetical protein